MLEEPAVLADHSFFVDDAPQAAVMEGAGGVDLCTEADIAREENAVELSQHEGKAMSNLPAPVDPVREQRDLKILLTGHEYHLPRPT